MKLASAALRILASCFLSVLTLFSQGQQSLKQNYEYHCQGERIVIGRCRRDSDRPGEPRTPDSMNYCQIVYPDRPKNNGLTLEGIGLRTDIERMLQACGALSATAKAPVGSSASTTNDPSIAKARAAKVDTTALGMQLGEPLRMPDCPQVSLATILNPLALNTNQDCRNSSEGLDQLAEVLTGVKSNKVPGEGTETVQLSEDHCPSWVDGCTAYVTLHNNSIVFVGVYTKGRNVAKTVTNELIEKYGKPTRVVLGEVTPDVGNAFKISEPEWTLPGLRVEYEIVIRTENEDRIETNRGIVRIMTESEYQRRLAEKAKPVKRKL